MKQNFFLHKVTSDLVLNRPPKIESANQEDEFKDREVLLVDDDMRNLFVLTKLYQVLVPG